MECVDHITLPRGPRPGDQFVITITDLHPQGLGFAVVPATIGPQRQQRSYKTYVRKALPGDVAHVEVESCRKGEITAHIVELLAPSEDRIRPRCQHFGLRTEPNSGCGGCTFQNLPLSLQHRQKQATVQQCFNNVGLSDVVVQPTLPTPEPWNYRNKMEFSFGPTTDGAYGLGMHPNGYRYDVIRQDECFLMSEFVGESVPRIRQWAEQLQLPYESKSGGWLKTLTIREGKRTGERLFELTTNHIDSIDGFEESPRELAQMFADEVRAICADFDATCTSIYWTQHVAIRGERTRLEEHLLYGSPIFTEELHLPGGVRLQFDIHPRAFFQPNTYGAEVIYSEVMRQAGVLTHPAKRILDLYCGTGTIALAVSKCAEEVVGVELVPDAVDNARLNAERNGITNARFLCGDVGEVLEREGLSGDVLIVDPPRAGLLPFAHEQIARIDADRLVYVSCKPSSLARDTRLLLAAGWEIVEVVPVDAFPQTYHIETVASFRRK